MLLSYKRYALLTILLMFFLDVVSIGLAYPIFSSMIFSSSSHLLGPEVSLAIRNLWLGILLALVPIAQFFSAPIWGTISDRIGRRTIMITSTALGVLGYTVALFGVWHANIILLAISRIIIGIATGNQGVGSAIIADISTVDEKTKHFGLLHMAGGLGMVAGPFLGGVLSKISFGGFSEYATPFACAGILTTINLLLIIFIFKETHAAIPSQESFSFGFNNIKRAWHTPGLFLLFAAIFIYNFGWSFYWDFIPVHWITSYKFDPSMVYNMYAVGALSYAFSSGLLIRPLVNRFKTEKIFFYSLIACSIAIGLLIFSNTPQIYWFFIPFQQFCMALVAPIVATIISNKSHADAQGEMMGVLESVQSLAGVISPLSAGILLNATVRMPLIVGACALMAAACILITKKSKTHS